MFNNNYFTCDVANTVISLGNVCMSSILAAFPGGSHDPSGCHGNEPSDS